MDSIYLIAGDVPTTSYHYMKLILLEITDEMDESYFNKVTIQL